MFELKKYVCIKDCRNKCFKHNVYTVSFLYDKYFVGGELAGALVCDIDELKEHFISIENYNRIEKLKKINEANYL